MNPCLAVPLACLLYLSYANKSNKSPDQARLGRGICLLFALYALLSNGCLDALVSPFRENGHRIHIEWIRKGQK